MRVRDVSLMVLGFAVAAAFVPGFVDAGGAPRWAAMAIGVPCCLFMLPHRSVSPWCFAWLPAAAITVAWAPDRLHALDELVHLAILAASFYLGACALSLGPLWRGVAAGLALNAAVALAQARGWNEIPQVGVPGGLFVNKNLLAEAGLVVAVTASSALAAGVAAFVVFVSGSKAVVGAAFVALAAWLMPRRPRIAWLIVAALAAAAALLFAYGAASAKARLDIWGLAWTYLSLPFGRGLGAFAIDFPAALHVHCEPLQLAYELGVLAIPFFAVLIYALGARPDGTEPERVLLVAIAAVALFSFPLHSPLTAFAAAVAAGHLCAARHRVRVRSDAWAMAPRFCP